MLLNNCQWSDTFESKTNVHTHNTKHVWHAGSTENVSRRQVAHSQVFIREFWIIHICKHKLENRFPVCVRLPLNLLSSACRCASLRTDLETTHVIISGVHALFVHHTLYTSLSRYLSISCTHLYIDFGGCCIRYRLRYSYRIFGWSTRTKSGARTLHPVRLKW